MKNIVILLFLCLGVIVQAQDQDMVEVENIITDRPDQTESSATVGNNVFQIETGPVLNVYDAFNNQLILLSLFRYGLGENFEFRLVSGLGRTHSTINTVGSIADLNYTEMSDLEVGFKYRLVNTSSLMLCYLGHAVFPSGTASANGKFGVVNKLGISTSLTDRISLGSNLGYTYFGEGKGDATYTLVLGSSLTDKIGFYAEIYGSLIEFDELTTNFDSGFTYLAKPNLQLDFSFGTGISIRSNYYSMGVSWRLPN